MSLNPDITLHELQQFPEGLLDVDASELHTMLSGPTLVHIAGERQPALFVSVLLHGNETTGWDAVRGLMSHYKNRQLPRAMSLFIGNIAAASVQQRRLPGQPDYNRVWPTLRNHGDTPEHRLVKQVFDIMQKRNVFLSIDIHNNTGLNPHYACINRLHNDFAHVARLFSKIVIYFTYPDGVQSHAFADICPAVTIECGQVGYQHGISHAQEYLDTCLHLEHIPTQVDPADEIVFYENFATITIATGVSFCFEDAHDNTANSVDLVFFPELDRYNFTELALGTPIAQINSDHEEVLDVITNDGENVFKDYFEIKRGMLVTRTQIIPSMLTADVEIVRKDCLCYLMGRIMT
ncbi:MAG: M14 family metallopeptidase [Thiohalomonadales bacterium]